MPIPLLTSVLLVDDDATTNYLNQLLLTATLGVTEQVLVAENGQQALQVLSQVCSVPASPTCPQLIFLDLNMPVMNGREFLRAYVQLPAAQRQHILVVMLTTSLHEQDRQLVQQFPIADFVTKPLTRTKVTDLLARHFPSAVA